MSKLSRREFLKSAAAGAAGLAAVNVLGVAAASEASVVELSADEDAGEGEGRVPGYCGPGDWLGEAPLITEDMIASQESFDVVILGGGNAGVLAAVGAVDKGASVAVVELEAEEIHQNSWYGEDIGHVNSKWLIDKGFGPYNTGEIVNEFCKRAAGRCMPEVIRLFVQNSGAMFDRYHEIYDMYLEDRLVSDSNILVAKANDGEENVYRDYSDMFQYPLCCIQQCHEEVEYPVTAGDYKTWASTAQFYGHQGNEIEYVNKYIMKYTQDMGAKWFFEHEGICLVTNDEGEVTGLIARDAMNRYVKLNANKGVIICAGDFVGDNRMTWALLNESMEWAERDGAIREDWASTSTRTGAGIKMACWAGGMVEPSPRGWMSMTKGTNGPWGFSPLLQLNCKGKRFYNEACISHIGAQLSRQPAGRAVYVTDANWAKTIAASPVDHGCATFGVDTFFDTLSADMAAIEVGNPEGGSVTNTVLGNGYWMKSTVYAANTLEELADFCGYQGEEKENFLQSIAHYNELCYSEEGDTDYGKDKKYMVPIDTPPFYAGVGNLSHSARPGMVTVSGLMTDENLNVINRDWQPIKGLYAAGNSLGGRYGLQYTTPFAGNSIGMVMTHGWVAGQIVADL